MGDGSTVTVVLLFRSNAANALGEKRALGNLAQDRVRRGGGFSFSSPPPPPPLAGDGPPPIVRFPRSGTPPIGLIGFVRLSALCISPGSSRSVAKSASRSRIIDATPAYSGAAGCETAKQSTSRAASASLRASAATRALCFTNGTRSDSKSETRREKEGEEEDGEDEDAGAVSDAASAASAAASSASSDTWDLAAASAATRAVRSHSSSVSPSSSSSREMPCTCQASAQGTAKRAPADDFARRRL